MNDHLIRCFISIHLPNEIREYIRTYLSELRQLPTSIRWVKVENIHLTLKFIGEINLDRVKEIEKKLNQIEGIFSPFDLLVSGSGCFPSRRNPRVFWLGLEQGIKNPLFGIHQWIEDQLFPLGFDKEKRRFSPHLTLGRVKNQEDFSNLYSFLDKNPFSKVSFTVDKLTFMRSELKPTGAEYSILCEYFF